MNIQKAIFFLLILCIGQNTPAKQPVIDEAQIRDMQLRTTYQGKPGLVRFIDRTQTVIGKEFLTNKVLNPINHVAQLERFQAATKTIINNPELSRQLDEKLNQFAASEKALCMCDDKKNSIATQTIKDFYFQTKYLEWLNNHPRALQAGQILQVASLFAPLFEHAAIHFLMGNCGHDHSCDHNHSHEHHHENNGHHDCHGHSSHGTTLSSLASLFKIYNAIHFGIHAINFKDMLQHVGHQATILKEIQKKLIEVRQCFDHAQEIINVIKRNQPLAEKLEHFQPLATLLSNPQSITPEFAEFITLIRANTFTGSPSIFSNHGNILRAYSLFAKIEPELMMHLKGIAEIDAHNSCARLYKEYQQTQTPFTFAEYANHEGTKFSIAGFWNPLTAKPQVIDQEINLGAESPRIAVITGPNKGGKSTSIGSIIAALALAQSIGMAPARNLQLTPFSRIVSAMNMPSRVQQGQSLFSASVDLATVIIRAAKNNSSEKIFVAFDELFTSTNPLKGQEVAVKFLQKIAQNKNVISLFATHFPKAVKLEHENPQVICNYKADSTADLFEMKPGFSHAEDAFALMNKNESSSDESDFLL